MPKRVERVDTTQPVGRRKAWRDAAKIEGKTLSEWIQECCDAFLPASVRAKLRERPANGRPPKREAER